MNSIKSRIKFSVAVFACLLTVQASAQSPGDLCLDCQFGFGVYDCNINCTPASWWADGNCDGGQRNHCGQGIDLDCSEMGCDNGDCPAGCNPAGGGPGAGNYTDCGSALGVCGNATLNNNSSGAGANDFASFNNNSGCLSLGEHQSSWYRFQIASGGTLGFDLDPVLGGAEDYDFAVFGPNVNCNNLGSPIRCSYAAGLCQLCPRTGLGQGRTDFSEGAGGDGYVAMLNVTAGQTYYLLVDNFNSSSSGFDLNWTGSATLDCSVICDLTVDAGSNQTICQGSIASMNASFSNNQGNPSFSWSASPNVVNFSSSSARNPNVSVNGGFSGSITLTLEVTDNFCSITDQMTLTVQANPSADAGNGGTTCNDFYNLSANPSTGTGTWTSNPSAGVSFTPNRNNPNAAGNYAGTGLVTFIWTETNGQCSDQDQVIVNFQDDPTVDAGQDGSTCGLSYILSGSLSGGNGSWRATGPGNASFAPNNTSSNPTITVDQYGVYNVFYDAIQGNCSASDMTQITFNQTPQADAGSGGTVCGQDFQLNATLNGNSGNWSVFSGGAANVSFTPNTSTPNATAQVTQFGTYTFRWTDSENGCSSTDDVTVTFQNGNPVDAGLDGTECDLEFSLSASTGGGVGGWSMSGPGTASYNPNASSSNAVVTVSQEGAYVFTWTETQGQCTISDDVNVQFSTTPTADAGSGGTVCGLEYTFNGTASIGSGQWIASGGGAVSYNPSNTNVNATVSVSNPGSYNFTWTETNGICSDNDQITVIFDSPIAVDAGADDSACELSYTFQTNSAGGNGLWSYSGPGLVNFVPDANTANATAEPSNDGLFSFIWEETVGTCTDRDTVEIDFRSQPVADAGQGGTICGLNFSLSANPSFGSGRWTSIGSGNATYAPHDSSANVSVTVDAAGVYHFVWTETNGFCSDADSAQVEFVLAPTVDAGSGGTVCGTVFTANGSNQNGTGSWSQVSGSGAASFPADPFGAISVDQFDTYTFRWTVAIGSCSDSADIIVTFNEIPVADAGQGGQSCGLSFTLNGTASVGTGNWSQVSGPGNSVLPSGASGSVTTDTYGSYTYKWTESNGNCADSAEVTVDYTEVPIADAGQGGTICGLSFNATGNNSTGTGQWTQISGPGTAQFPLAASGSISVDLYGSYTFQWKETNGNCADSASIAVTFDEVPQANAGAGGSVCGFDFTVNAIPSVGTGTWSQVSGPGSSILPATASGTITADQYGAYIFRWKEENGSCSDSSDIAVNFVEVPVADAGVGDTLCGLVFTATGSISSGNGSWSQLLGAGSATFPATPDGQITVDNYGAYSFQWRVSDGSCADSASIEVRFDEQPQTNAGIGDTTCGLNALLTATASVGNLLWSQLSGSGTALLPNTASGAVSVDQFGDYSFQFREVNGICADSATVSFQFNEPPNANAGIDKDSCSNSIPLNATPSAGTGIWTFNGPGTLQFNPSMNDPAAIATASVSGAYELIWTETNADCADADTIQLNFNANPVIEAVAVDSAICADGSTNITVNILNGNSIATYTWTGAISALSDAQVQSPVFDGTQAQSGLNSLNVQVTDNNGCTAADGLDLQVNDLPDPQIDPASPFVCVDAQIQLNTLLTAGTAPYQFNWTGSTASLDDASIQNPVFDATGLTGGTMHPLRVDLIDDNACAAFDTVTVEVLADLLVTFSPDPAELCQGEQLILNATVSGGTGTITYQWSGDVASLNSTAVSSPEFDAAGLTAQAYNLNLAVSDQSGCSGTGAMIVTVNENPAVNITPNPASLCWPDSVQVTANASGGSAPYVYNWNNSGGTLSNATIADPFFRSNNLTPAQYQVIVDILDANNCAASASSIVDVNEIPTVVLAPNPHEICSDENFNISATIAQGSAPFSFSWSGDTTYLSTTQVQNPQFIGPQVNQTTFANLRFDVTDAAGCSAFDAMNVTIHPEPGGDAGVDREMCLDEVIAIGGAPIIAGNGPFTYQWQPSTGLDNPTAYTPNASPQQTTTYVITTTDAMGCQSQDSMTVTVSALPVIFLPDDTTLCSGGNLSVSLPVVSGFTYEWSNGDTSSTLNTNPTFDQTYTVTITDTSNGCEWSDFFSVFMEPYLPEVVPGDTTIELGQPVVLDVIGVDGENYFWTPSDWLSDHGSQSPVGMPMESITYSVFVTDSNGCSGSASVDIEVIPPPTEIYVPTAFSPNGDGVNDVFNVFTSPNLEVFEVMVFNRWGARVFYYPQDHNAKGWDGFYRETKQPIGNYVFQVLAIDRMTGEKHTRSGNLTLLR